MGWGSMQYDSLSPSEVLKEVNVTLENDQNCAPPDIICHDGGVGPSKV